MKGKSVEQTQTEAEIIFSDEDMDPIMRLLIEKGVEKGYSKSNVVRALVSKWDDIQPFENPVVAPREEELVFWEKVDKFIEEYGDLLVLAHDDACDDESSRIKGKEKSTRWFFDRTKSHLCAAFCAFNRDDSFSQKRIRKYAETIVGSRQLLFSEDVSLVNKVITTMLMYDRDIGYKPMKFYKGGRMVYLREVPSFIRFHEKYRRRRTTYIDSVMNCIWFISTNMT